MVLFIFLFYLSTSFSVAPTLSFVRSPLDTMGSLQRDRPDGPNLEGDDIERTSMELSLPTAGGDAAGAGLELPPELREIASGNELWAALTGGLESHAIADNTGAFPVDPIEGSPGHAGSVEHKEESARAEADKEQLNLGAVFRGSSLSKRPMITVEFTPPIAPPHLREDQGPVVAVPADGLCLYYCAVACGDLARWAATHYPKSGLAKDTTARAQDVSLAWIYRDRVIAAARHAGDSAMADRLARPGLLGYPDQDALPYLAQALEGQIVLQSMSIQTVFGEGPLQAHLLFCMSVDGAGKSSGHFAVLQSWVPLPGAEKRQRVHEDGSFNRNDSSSVLRDSGNRPAPAIEGAASPNADVISLSAVSSVPQENLNPSLREDAQGDRVADADQQPRDDSTRAPDQSNTAAFLDFLGNAAGGFGERPNEVDVVIDMGIHILS